MLKVFKLKNGLTVFLNPEENHRLVAIYFVIRAGSEYETKDKNGTAHFLEHMYFKGSKNFPSAKELHYALEKHGAYVNAVTSYEATLFYAIVPPRNLKFILEVFADILKNPLFPQEEIDKERNVIIEELNMYEDDPKRKITDYAYETIFGDQPAGWPIGGTKETLQQISRQDLINFYNKNYSSLNTALIISGAFEITQNLIKSISELLSDYKKIKPASKPRAIFNPGFKINIYPNSKINQAHLAISFSEVFNKLPSIQKRINITHLATILGVGLSSRLFHILREELGVAYYTYTYFDVYPERYIFSIYAGVDLNKVQISVEKILTMLSDCKEKGFLNEELIKSKNILEASLIGNLETSANTASRIAESFILKEKLFPIKTLLNFIRKTDLGDLKKAANELFNYSKSSLVLIYPEDNQILKNELRKHFAEKL